LSIAAIAILITVHVVMKKPN